MRKRSRLKMRSVLVAMLIAFASCDKYNDDRELLTSENHTLAEASFLYIMHNVILAATPEGELLQDSCFKIAHGTNTFPLAIDFGGKGCKGLFDIQTSGSLSAVFPNSATQSDTIVVTANNLYINGFGVAGTVLIIDMGLNTSGRQVYRLVVQDGIITASEENNGENYTVIWNCDYTLELLERNNATFTLDDLYGITGTASGVNQEGRNFTAEITHTLMKYVDCRWVGAGTSKISPQDLKERDLFYGEDCIQGANCCDNIAKELAPWVDPTVRMK